MFVCCFSNPRGCNVSARIFLSLEAATCVCVCVCVSGMSCLRARTMSVNVSVFVNVNESGHWVCGESWHATKDL